MQESNRKIAMVFNQVRMDDEDALDIDYWRSKPFSERLSEVLRLRKKYYTWINGSFPDKIEKVFHQRKM